MQKSLDQRIGMNMVGNLDPYTQFAAAQSMTIAAANPNGAVGLGMGIGPGAAVAQLLAASLKFTPAPPSAGAPATATDTRFCIACGHSIPQRSSFCPDCGKAQ